jgi:hypothetical protein
MYFFDILTQVHRCLFIGHVFYHCLFVRRFVAFQFVVLSLVTSEC